MIISFEETNYYAMNYQEIPCLNDKIAVGTSILSPSIMSKNKTTTTPDIFFEQLPWNTWNTCNKTLNTKTNLLHYFRLWTGTSVTCSTVKLVWWVLINPHQPGVKGKNQRNKQSTDKL